MNPMPLVIYISSPYTVGDVGANVSRQIEAAHRIMDMGHAPIVPLLSHFLHIHRQRPYEDWMQVDLATVRVCDIVLRLPGESKGADREVEQAKRYNIPVAYGWDGLAKELGSAPVTCRAETKSACEELVREVANLSPSRLLGNCEQCAELIRSAKEIRNNGY